MTSSKGHVFAAVAALLTGALLFAQNPAPQAPPAGRGGGGRGAAKQAPPPPPAYPAALVTAGQAVFLRECAFCHGQDAEGGETGPDLTRSALVTGDVNGNAIAPVIRGGRSDKGMPSFNLSNDEVSGVVAFIHMQKYQVETQFGQRRGVDAADLQTGNADAGKQYFNANCAMCHSPTGDLAGIAARLRGLQLEQQMLAPRNPKSAVTVTLPGGKTVTGTLAFHDEFTIALRDASGKYQSWAADTVKFKIDSPADAHVELYSKYTDADIHNLMAYLQTLR